MQDKYKILTISDHPLVSSGVGTQTKYILEHLLRTGKYQIRSLGGALKHQDFRPQKLQEYEDDWIIFPIEGYGNPQVIRELLDYEKPDALWVMTDPRFFTWLFDMSDEIRDRNIPFFYYHVWDEFPVPEYNKRYYMSCDYIGCISKVTNTIVKELGHPNFDYIPHAVDGAVFKPISQEDRKKLKKEVLGKHSDKFVYFYNSRNARRKMTSDVVRFFKETLDAVGEDKVFMFMHTDPRDPEGANLLALCDKLGLTPDNITFNPSRIPPEKMAELYNIADTTVCLSNNEGFGLSSLESLMCGTPVISVKTGGLQDQNVDPETGEEFGVSITPKTNSYTGSQQIPYIRDCRCTDEDMLNAYLKMFNMPEEERVALGMKGYEFAKKNFPLYGPGSMTEKWEKVIEKEIKQFKENGYSGRVKLAKM